MDINKVKKMVKVRTKLNAEIAKLNAQIKPIKDQKNTAETWLMKFINKEDDGAQSIKSGGINCHAKSSANYSLIPQTGRADLDEWVVSPITDALNQHFGNDKIPAELREALDETIEHLAVFKNDPVKSYVEQYRLDTGAKQITSGNDAGKLEGGDLPDGIRVFSKLTLGFTKA